MVSLYTFVYTCMVAAASAKPFAKDPVAPSQDPWYTAPPGYQRFAPGSVLRVRPAPGNLTSVFPGAKCAWNILYRTTDSLGEASYAVTTLLKPGSKANRNALVSYQLPYDTASVDSSPSFALYGKDITGQEAIPLLLEQGYYTSIPDYEGPKAAFTAGLTSGYATLDGVRAVHSLSYMFGLDWNAKNALWGYSGGALASEWAAEVQTKYAPDVSFAGAALGGLTPIVANTIKNLNGAPFAGLDVAVLLGLGNQYPEFKKRVNDNLKQTGTFNKSAFEASYHYSFLQGIVAYYQQDITQYFEHGWDDIFNDVTNPIFEADGVMGNHGVPSIPLYVYKAIQDEISAVKDTDDLVNKYCDAGVNILYERNTVGDHEAEFTSSIPSAMQFLASVFSKAGPDSYPSFPKQGCNTITVTRQ